MEPEKGRAQSANGNARPEHGFDSTPDGIDPELEKEFEELAQWLLDIYLWELEKDRKVSGNTEIDSEPRLLTIEERSNKNL